MGGRKGRFPRIGFRVLGALAVLWGTVSAAVVFAIRFDLFPHQEAPEIPSPGESVEDLEFLPLPGNSEAFRADRPRSKTAIVFFDPADDDSRDLVGRLTGGRLPAINTGVRPLALVLKTPARVPGSPTSVDALGCFRLDEETTQRLRYLPSAWLIRDGAVQAVIEGFGGAEALAASVTEFVGTASGNKVWPKMAVSGWGRIIPPESALQEATGLQRVRDFLGPGSTSQSRVMTRVALVWRSSDSTSAWQIDLAKPNCNCPFDRVERWDETRVMLDPTNGQVLDVIVRGALTTAELRAYVPTD
ncbi:MAG: hypothetical protein AB1792_07935 [Candidatus Zixiibacteriota bacterium]